jgi:hypothetical protein
MHVMQVGLKVTHVSQLFKGFRLALGGQIPYGMLVPE